MKKLIVLAFLFFPGLLSAQVTQEAFNSCVTCSTVTATFGLTVTAGDAILASCGYMGPFNGVATLSDNISSTYSAKTRGNNTGNGFGFISAGWSCGTAGGSSVAVTCNTATTTEGAIAITIQEVAGLPSACVVQSSIGQGCVAGCGSILSGGNVTTTASGEFLESVIWENSGTGINPSHPASSPFTYRTSVFTLVPGAGNLQVVNADSVAGPPNLYNNSFTYPQGTNNWDGWTLAFTSAPGTAHSHRHAQVY